MFCSLCFVDLPGFLFLVFSVLCYCCVFVQCFMRIGEQLYNLMVLEDYYGCEG